MVFKEHCEENHLWECTVLCCCDEYLLTNCDNGELVLQVYFLNQEEDSEEEPKLKYERLSNGVTEILQNDAASCMTVHDKVKVMMHHPQGHFRLKSTHLK